MRNHLTILRFVTARGSTVGAVLVVAGLLAGLAGPSLANVNVSKSGWAWSNPTPQGRTLRAIAFSGGAGYAVGDGGTALYTTNGGQSWGGLVTGTAATLERVQVLVPSTIVVGGNEGCVTRISTDGGQIFRRIFSTEESSCEEPVAAFSFISPQIGVLLLKNGSIETTSDGGETFSRKTGVPGTPAASGGGSLIGTDIHFTGATRGIAFVRDSSSGVSTAYMTPDGGVSWSPVTLPAGAKVTSVHYVDAQHAYAIGPETLLRTVDGGEKWEAEPAAKGNSFNSIDCSTAKRCILTVTGGNELVQTTDGGATDTVKTISSALLYGAGYATPAQLVAVGANGATVLSSDGGATFAPASADIGGEYGRLRLGPSGMLVAPGAKGDAAISSDGGQSWHVIATQTSQELVDAVFASATLGYALDSRGGLQRTTNGGASWQTLSPGTTRPARAVLALGSGTALLIGPVGVNRSVGGGRFEPVASRVARKAHLSDYELAGSAIFAFGESTHTLIRSTDEGARWSAVRLPLARAAAKGTGTKRKASPGVAIRSASFTSAQVGFLLDTSGRLWSTRNGGRSWTQLLSAGTGEGVQLAFSGPSEGFMSVRGLAGDHRDAYVLRTSDGGRTWHPQEIAAGSIPSGGLVSSSALDAAALIDGPSAGAEAADRLLFATSTGGDVAGSAGTLSLSTPLHVITKRVLRRDHYSVRIEGTLTGATGGEQIVVSHHNLAGGPWEHQVVVAGANGGTFSSTWVIRHSCVFVAQWAGDSGRPGQGSTALKIIVGGR
jgi:photosystem II stability/assembly factor-like uncharacterized protein